MKEQFATYEIALALKELGFNEECFGYFDEDSDFSTFEYYDSERQNSTIQSEYAGIKQCTAPLWQQVIDWFEDKHELVLQYDDRTAGCRGLNWLLPTIIRLTSYGSENVTPIRFRNSIFYNKEDAREQTILNAIKVLNENMVK